MRVPEIGGARDALLPHASVNTCLAEVKVRGPEGRSSILEASANFVNIVVGAGIVGLPYVLVQAGFWTALVELIMCCVLTHYSVRMLIDVGIAQRIYSYEDLCEHALGRAGKVIVSFALLAFDYGAMLSYEIILADASSAVAYELWGYRDGGQPYWVRPTCLVVLSTLLILPSCLYRDMSHLEKLSAVSIFTVVVITAIVLWKYVANEPRYAAERITALWPTKNINVNDNAVAALRRQHTASVVGPNVFKSFSIIAFSFVCHDSAFMIFNTLRHPTSARWGAVSALSLSSALVVCCLLAVPGYLTFGAKTEANLLNNYDISDGVVIFMRCIYVLTMAFTYPLTFFVARHIVNVWAFAGPRYQTVQRMPRRRHFALTFGLFFSALCIALFVQDLGDVMSLAGSFGAVVLAFVLPPLCKLRLERSRGHSVCFWQDPRPIESARATLPCIGFIVFGAVAIAGSVAQVINL